MDCLNISSLRYVIGIIEQTTPVYRVANRTMT